LSRIRIFRRQATGWSWFGRWVSSRFGKGGKDAEDELANGGRSFRVRLEVSDQPFSPSRILLATPPALISINEAAN
jgi:hypothetical protein